MCIMSAISGHTAIHIQYLLHLINETLNIAQLSISVSMKFFIYCTDSSSFMCFIPSYFLISPEEGNVAVFILLDLVVHYVEC